jgi:hypothetical protein
MQVLGVRVILVELTFLRVDLLSYVEVYAQYDQVGDDVHGANAHKDLWVVEGDLLRHLHHTKYDHQIGAIT